MSDQEKAKPAASSPHKPTAKKAPKKVATGKHPGGRPTAYVQKVHAKLAYALAVRGLTDEQMAAEIGVSVPTFYAWQKKYPEFLKALKLGKEDPDSAVESALFKKATGFKQIVQKPMVVSQGQNMGSEVEIVNYEDTISPDTTAQIFWLKNRRPDRWRDKQEIENTGMLGLVDLTTLTPEEFEKKKAEFLAKNGGGKKAK